MQGGESSLPRTVADGPALPQEEVDSAVWSCFAQCDARGAEGKEHFLYWVPWAQFQDGKFKLMAGCSDTWQKQRTFISLITRALFQGGDIKSIEANVAIKMTMTVLLSSSQRNWAFPCPSIS